MFILHTDHFRVQLLIDVLQAVILFLNEICLLRLFQELIRDLLEKACELLISSELVLTLSVDFELLFLESVKVCNFLFELFVVVLKLLDVILHQVHLTIE